MPEKIFVTAALTGAATPKDINENIPITSEEIAEDAYNCWKAGAAIAHLHMRDENAKGTKASNVMLVKRAVRVVKEFGKTPATSAEAREILGIKPLVR